MLRPDCGFKKIFGEQTGKAHLISFLNTRLPKTHQIRDLPFCRARFQRFEHYTCPAVSSPRRVTNSRGRSWKCG